MSSDDEFEVNFVTNASKIVKKKWQKIDKAESDELKDVTNTNGPGDEFQKKRKKSNNFMDNNEVRVKIVDRNCDSSDEDAYDTVEEATKKKSEVTITPPGSPIGIEKVKVRGAKASKKTVNALNKLQTQSQKLVMARRQLGAGEELDDLDDCRLVSVASPKKTFMLKICWKSSVERLEVSATDRIGKVTDEFTKKVGAERGELSLYREEMSGDALGREQSLADLGVSFVTVLHARTKVLIGKEAEKELLELKLQTKDRRAPAVLVKIKPTDTMETVMIKYSEETAIDRSKLKFFFDGEEVECGDTAEDLELEGEECFDVHVKD